MDCDRIKEQLHALADGELTGEETAAVEEHLSQCDACRAELDAVNMARSFMASHGKVDSPPDMAEAIRNTLEQEGVIPKRVAPLRSRRKFALPKISTPRAAALAAAFVVVLLGAGIFRFFTSFQHIGEDKQNPAKGKPAVMASAPGESSDSAEEKSTARLQPFGAEADDYDTLEEVEETEAEAAAEPPADEGPVAVAGAALDTWEDRTAGSRNRESAKKHDAGKTSGAAMAMAAAPPAPDVNDMYAMEMAEDEAPYVEQPSSRSLLARGDAPAAAKSTATAASPTMAADEAAGMDMLALNDFSSAPKAKSKKDKNKEEKKDKKKFLELFANYTSKDPKALQQIAIDAVKARGGNATVINNKVILNMSPAETLDVLNDIKSNAGDKDNIVVPEELLKGQAEQADPPEVQTEIIIEESTEE